MTKESESAIKQLMKLRVDNKYLAKCAELLIASGNYKEAERAIEDIRPINAGLLFFNESGV